MTITANWRLDTHKPRLVVTQLLQGMSAQQPLYIAADPSTYSTQNMDEVKVATVGDNSPNITKRHSRSKSLSTKHPVNGENKAAKLQLMSAGNWTLHQQVWWNAPVQRALESGELRISQIW